MVKTILHYACVKLNIWVRMLLTIDENFFILSTNHKSFSFSFHAIYMCVCHKSLWSTSSLVTSCQLKKWKETSCDKIGITNKQPKFIIHSTHYTYSILNSWIHPIVAGVTGSTPSPPPYCWIHPISSICYWIHTISTCCCWIHAISTRSIHPIPFSICWFLFINLEPRYCTITMYNVTNNLREDVLLVGDRPLIWPIGVE